MKSFLCITLVGVLSLLATGNTLKCYVCNSEFDGEACETSPPASKFLVECTPETAKPGNKGAMGESRVNGQSGTTSTPSNSTSHRETSTTTRKPISPHEILAISPVHNNTNNESSSSMNSNVNQSIPVSVISTSTSTTTTSTPSSISVSTMLSTQTTAHEASTTEGGDTRSFRNSREMKDQAAEELMLTMGTVHNYTMCRKDDITIPDQHNGEYIQKGKRIVYRSCGWIGRPEKACKSLPSETLTTFQCSCVTDSCNSSNSITPAHAALFIALVSCAYIGVNS